MNPVNQAQVKGFAEAYGLESESLSNQFELYAIYSILNGGSGENVDPFSAHLKGDEFGLDGVAIVIQGSLVTDLDEAAAALEDIKNASVDFHFFQSKTSSSFDYGDIRKFFDSIKGFMDGFLKGESEQLDDLIAAREHIYEHGVTKRNPGIFCYYVTTGRYEPASSVPISRLVQNTEDELREAALFDEDRISISLIGAGDLQRLYRAAVTASQVRVEFKDAVVLPEHEDVERARIVQMQPFYKAFTASILGAPQRAARNYRSEIESRSEAIFLEDDDVRPAHAAAFLHYRMEFLWRNQKISNELKIYRYYFMDAAARQILAGKKFMNLTKANKGKFAQQLVDLAADEGRMKKLIAKVQKVLEDQFKKSSISKHARERLRDTIRSESFAQSVIPTYTPEKSSI